MSTELQQRHQAIDGLADEIKRRHSECDRIQQGAVNSISATIDARISVAKLVEAAQAQIGTGIAFIKWWRERDMPAGWADKYLRLAKTAERHTLGDKSQLRLIGLLPEAEAGNEGQQRQSNPFEWTKWTGKARAWFTGERIASMGPTDRAVAAKQLEPIVRVYNELMRG